MGETGWNDILVKLFKSKTAEVMAVFDLNPVQSQNLFRQTPAASYFIQNEQPTNPPNFSKKNLVGRKN